MVDPRVDRSKKHLLIDLLVISVSAMLCGAESFVEIADFGRAREAWLRGFLSLPHGIASHDTFRRVFMLIQPTEFAGCFTRWTQGLREDLGREVVAIDGKSLRRSFDRSKGRGPIHMVNAWATENGLALGQVKTDDKSNEITAVPELIRTLELTGCIVTLDAMGCQKNIAKEICEADADYVLALKGNHETAHDEVRTFLQDARAKDWKQVPYDFVETIEKGHGRIETRRYWITEQIAWFADRSQWEGLRSMGMVESIRQINDSSSTEVRFFLSSLPAQAQEFARAVRNHWRVENNLHWVLDICFAEDQCRTRAGFAAQNLAILRQITLNILKKDKTLQRGIKAKQKNAAWNNDYLFTLLKI